MTIFLTTILYVIITQLFSIILDQWLTILMAFFHYCLKTLLFSVFPYIAIYPLHRLISWNMTTQCLAVTGNGSVIFVNEIENENGENEKITKSLTKTKTKTKK